MCELQIGPRSQVDESVVLGYGDHDGPTRIGADAVVRAGTTVYGDVRIGDRFQSGHDVLVREETVIGDDVLLGTRSIVDGRTVIGSRVSVQSAVYVPANTTIGSDVFLGPGSVLTNDPYPIRTDAPLEGPTVADGASVGANATILPGVTVGEDAFVAAGAVVTEDVPAATLAVGAPARCESLPSQLAPPNTIE